MLLSNTPANNDTWHNHLLSLLARARALALSEGSSTVVSVVLLTAGAIILGWIITLLIEWHRGGRTVSSLKTALRSWPAYVGGFSAFVLVWISLYGWSIAAIVYQDHQTLVSERNGLATVNDSLKTEEIKKDQRIQTLERSVPTSHSPAISKSTLVTLVQDLQKFTEETRLRRVEFNKEYISNNEVQAAKRESFDKTNGFLFNERFRTRLQSVSLGLKQRGFKDQADFITGVLNNSYAQFDPTSGATRSTGSLSEPSVQDLIGRLSVTAGLLQ